MSSMSAKNIVFFVILAIAPDRMASSYGGESDIYRRQDGWGNYEFSYGIRDHMGAETFRKESGDAATNAKWGSYGIQDIDGRWRIVEYIADKDGFRARIKTNEPGTQTSNPAGVTINGPDGLPPNPHPVQPLPLLPRLDVPVVPNVEDVPVLNSLHDNYGPPANGFFDGILDLKSAASKKNRTMNIK